MRIRSLPIIVLLSLTDQAFAQESEYEVNIDWNHERHAWKASWITHPTASVYDYGVFNFRNSFELDKVPDGFTIYVSADNRYRLFVNGQEVSSGPARGSLEYWRYETVDISDHLKKGKNLIAAEVFNLGEHRPAAQFSHKTALIVQSEALGEQVNTGSGHWKVARNNAYRPIAVTPEMVAGKYYVAGPCDSISAADYPWDWEKLAYDDAGWFKPKIIQLGCGRGYMHGSPWWLVPRNIPPMEQVLTRFEKVARHHPTDAHVQEGFIAGTDPLIVPANTTWSLLLDNEKLLVGYPELLISGGKGSTIQVTYAEALYDKDGEKGYRNEIEGKEIIGYYDVLLPDGSSNRLMRPLWLRTYRYVQLDIQTGGAPLTLHDFYGLFTAYPFDLKATFESDDESLRDIWEVAWHTARCCAGETYMDCPYWEQLQYLGDTRIQSLISLYVTGDDRLMRNALELADQSRIPEGLTLARGPSAIPQITPPYSLYWIDMVHDYFMHRRDEDFIEQFLPGIAAVLGWFERRMDENGLLGGLDWLNFTDWTTGFMCGAPAGTDLGGSALISLNYAYALDRAATLFAHFNQDELGAKFRSQSASLKKAVYRECFDPTAGLLADIPSKDVFSQHTNIFGVLTDAIPPANQRAVLQKVLEDTALIQTTIYFKFYLFQALQHAGMADQYIHQLGPWHEMIAKGLSTFEEGDYNERSDCHAWGSSPMFDLLATMCGIRPASPGFQRVLVAPALGPLTQVRASMPHPDGEIVIHLQMAEGKLHVELSLPGEVEGNFIWQNKTYGLKPGMNNFDI